MNHRISSDDGLKGESEKNDADDDRDGTEDHEEDEGDAQAKSRNPDFIQRKNRKL